MAQTIEANLRWERAFLEAEWRLLLPVTLAFLALPPLLFSLALPVRFTTMPQTLADVQAIGNAMPGWAGPLGFALMLVTMVGALAVCALAVVPRISVAEAIRLALWRLPAWLGAALIAVGGVTVLAVAVGTALLLAGLAQAIVVLLIVVAWLLAVLFAILLLPLAADRALGPIGLLRGGWTLYRRDTPRLVGGSAAVWVASWTLSFAIQVALGSMLLMAGRAAGQDEIGRTLAALLSSVLGALQWTFFYVFVAGFYRARAGAIAGH